MDENYLDSLLNEFSLDKEIDHKIEDELDNQIEKEKVQKQKEEEVSQEEAFNMDLERDADVNQNMTDLQFSEEQIEELDHLDNLADMDMGDMDFSDIDFNDMDITKLGNVGEEDLDSLLKDFEGDLEIGDFFGDTNKEANIPEPELQSSWNEENISNGPELSEELNEDSFDADQLLNSLLYEAEPSATEPMTGSTLDNENQSIANMEPMTGQIKEAPLSETEMMNGQGDDLADLFSMLDTNEGNLEKNDSMESIPETAVAKEITTDKTEHKGNGEQKKSFMQVLFGDPDEDDELSPEEIAEIENKKQAKKAKKQAAKEAKKAKQADKKGKKALAEGQKKREEEKRKRLKAQKKAKQKAEELANAEPDKKLNKPAVIFIFSLFLGGLFLFTSATNSLNYTQAIEKATKYFSKQKYRSAYNQIAGVKIKQKDQKIKDSIYTVM